MKPRQVDALVARCDALVKKADGNWQVTADMLKRNARVTGSNRAVLDALHSRGVYLRPMREKPLLTADDMKERRCFAVAHRNKPASFWTSHIHLTIDVKLFKVCVNGTAPAHPARPNIRGPR